MRKISGARIMKKILLFLAIISFNAFGADFTPTNFTGSKDEVRTLFSTLWKDFKQFDNFHCYRRAHVVAHQMNSMQVKSMKAFFLRGDKLKMPLDWWYHVAPMVYYQGNGVVMDRGLLEGATHLEDWLLALSKGKQCKEIQSMNEYRSLKGQEHCFFMIVPMYYYGPEQLEDLTLDSFVMEDLQDMLFSLPARKRDNYQALYPLNTVETR